MNNANMANDNFGFYSPTAHFHTVDFPTGDNASPPVDQLLGVNDNDIAVGFYTDGQGNNHGYTYNIRTTSSAAVTGDPAPPGASLTAAAINNQGDIAGFYTDAAGTTDGFLDATTGSSGPDVPGASATQALGVNDRDEVVGVYTVGTGSRPRCTASPGPRGVGFRTVDDPHGVGTTTINGVNDRGQLVGFYVDAAGNTDGFLATPR